MSLYDYECSKCKRVTEEISTKRTIRCTCGGLMFRHIGGKNVRLKGLSTDGRKD